MCCVRLKCNVYRVSGTYDDPSCHVNTGIAPHCTVNCEYTGIPKAQILNNVTFLQGKITHYRQSIQNLIGSFGTVHSHV